MVWIVGLGRTSPSHRRSPSRSSRGGMSSRTGPRRSSNPPRYERAGLPAPSAALGRLGSQGPVRATADRLHDLVVAVDLRAHSRVHAEVGFVLTCVLAFECFRSVLIVFDGVFGVWGGV